MRIFYLILALFVISPSYADTEVIAVGQPASVGAPTYTCVGWPSSGCVPTGTPATESASTLDRTYTRGWTATEGGTAISINAYVTAWNPLAGYIRLYKQAGGTGDWVLVGQATVTSSITEDTWNKITLSAFGAQSLTFASGDVLYFGIAWDEEGATASALGRNEAAGSLFSVTTPVDASEPDPITTWTETTTRDVALVFEYDPA